MYLNADDVVRDGEPGVDIWTCKKCKREFIDPEDFPSGWIWEEDTIRLEVKMYWLGINEPVCENCAIDIGIPPIDKE